MTLKGLASIERKRVRASGTGKERKREREEETASQKSAPEQAVFPHKAAGVF